MRSKKPKPKRVEILLQHGRPSIGKFGYVIRADSSGDKQLADRGWHEVERSEPGELAFLVSRTPAERLGLWYSAASLRFTKPPTDLIAQLSDEEKVALDLVVQGNNGKLLAELVPNEERRDLVKTVAAQVKSLRAR